MSELEFISGMKRLSTLYFKDLSEDQIKIWYEMFNNIPYNIFIEAIKKISRVSKYMPNANKLLDSCKELNVEKVSYILKAMYENRYFHKGYKELNDRQANLNYDKCLKWIENGIIPSFLEDDIQTYLNKEQKINKEDLYYLISPPRVMDIKL